MPSNGRAGQNGWRNSVLSGAVEFKQVRRFVAKGWVVLVLTGCAAVPHRTTTSSMASPQPLARMVIATPDPEHDLLAQLLGGELALSGADLKAASQSYDKAMMISSDPEVAGKAAALGIA